MSEDRKPLTRADKENVFRRATISLPNWYADELKRGMTDEELEDALKAVLGIFGGSSGADRLSVSHQGSGLRIWGSWEICNHMDEPPLFAGKKTIAMARFIYDISDPSNLQMSLL